MSRPRLAGPLGRRDAAAMVLAAVAVNVLGALGVPFTTPDAAWFQALELPAFYPPNWAFGVVWPILYALMGVAVVLVYREGRARGAADGVTATAASWVPRDGETRVALGLFAVQLVVNVSWSPVFWGLRRIDLGLVVLAAVVVLASVTAVAFARVDRRAGLLLVPYIAWVAFATVLNGAIVWLN